MYTNTEINNARQLELVPINYKKKEKYGFKKSQKKQYVHLQQQRISMITKESKKEYSTKSLMHLQTKRISKIYLTRAIKESDTFAPPKNCPVGHNYKIT